MRERGVDNDSRAWCLAAEQMVASLQSRRMCRSSRAAGKGGQCILGVEVQAQCSELHGPVGFLTDAAAALPTAAAWQYSRSKGTGLGSAFVVAGVLFCLFHGKSFLQVW